MANAIFPAGREGFLDGSIDWDSMNIKVMLTKSTYTYDPTDKFVTDLGAVDNGRSANLGTKTVTDGVAGAADTIITATAAVACNALIVFYDTGVDGTARLIAYIDGATGLPLTPAVAGVVNIAWDAGVNKIFTL
jgi:hypothetical protein